MLVDAGDSNGPGLVWFLGLETKPFNHNQNQTKLFKIDEVI